MKEKVLTLLLGLGLAIMLTGCGSAVGSEGTQTGRAPINKETDKVIPDTNATENANTPNTIVITENEAKAIALEHAGVAESDVVFLTLELDRDNGRQVYEVEFYNNNSEYDYDIDAATGKILGYDTDIESYSPTSPNISNSSGNAEVVLAQDEAIKIALDKVPGATKENIRIHLDYDDGMAVFEGKIIYNEMEYEFEISATDGTVREWSVESIYDD